MRYELASNQRRNCQVSKAVLDEVKLGRARRPGPAVARGRRSILQETGGGYSEAVHGFIIRPGGTYEQRAPGAISGAAGSSDHVDGQGRNSGASVDVRGDGECCAERTDCYNHTRAAPIRTEPGARINKSPEGGSGLDRGQIHSGQFMAEASGGERLYNKTRHTPRALTNLGGASSPAKRSLTVAAL